MILFGLTLTVTSFCYTNNNNIYVTYYSYESYCSSCNLRTWLQISDVGIRDNRESHTRGTGARNERHLAAVNYNVRAGVEVVQGLLDNIMIALRIPYNEDAAGDGYWLEGKDRE